MTNREPFTQSETPQNISSEPLLSAAVIDKVDLRDQLQKNFTMGELRVLAADLGVAYEDLRHERRGDFVLELVAYAERHGLLAELAEKTKGKQPLLTQKTFRQAIQSIFRWRWIVLLFLPIGFMYWLWQNWPEPVKMGVVPFSCFPELADELNSLNSFWDGIMLTIVADELVEDVDLLVSGECVADTFLLRLHMVQPTHLLVAEVSDLEVQLRVGNEVDRVYAMRFIETVLDYLAGDYQKVIDNLPALRVGGNETVLPGLILLQANSLLFRGEYGVAIAEYDELLRSGVFVVEAANNKGVAQFNYSIWGMDEGEQISELCVVQVEPGESYQTCLVKEAILGLESAVSAPTVTADSRALAWINLGIIRWAFTEEWDQAVANCESGFQIASESLRPLAHTCRALLQYALMEKQAGNQCDPFPDTLLVLGELNKALEQQPDLNLAWFVKAQIHLLAVRCEQDVEEKEQQRQQAQEALEQFILLVQSSPIQLAFEQDLLEIALQSVE